MGIWNIFRRKKADDAPAVESPSATVSRNQKSDELAEFKGWLDEIAAPPLGGPTTTAAERRQARVASHQSELAERRASNLAEGGNRAHEERTMAVRGINFLEWVEPIKQMKRDGQLNQALNLLYECIEANEKWVWGPAPWYTWEAAVIHRKMKNYGAEVDVLERYLKAIEGRQVSGSKIDQIPVRLTKARELLAKQDAQK